MTTESKTLSPLIQSLLKLGGLSAMSVSHRDFCWSQDQYIITESQLAALVAQEMEKVKEECARACVGVRTGGNGMPKDYEDTHADGFTDGCNECEWAIRALPTTKQEG